MRLALYRSLLVLSFASVLRPAIAAECSAAPLGDAVVDLRGGMNSWGIDDDYAFQYSCDAYYLNVNANGRA